MSSTERNKVKSFGDPSIDHEEMADRFLVVGALKAPPVSNRVKLDWILGSLDPGILVLYEKIEFYASCLNITLLIQIYKN